MGLSLVSTREEASLKAVITGSGNKPGLVETSLHGQHFGMVVHTNPSTLQAEASGSLSVWGQPDLPRSVSGQPRPGSKIFSCKTKSPNNNLEPVGRVLA